MIICGTGMRQFLNMMTSPNGNISRVTGPLCGEFTVTGEFPAQRPVTRGFDVSLICARINGWVNNRKAGDLRRHRAHYDVSVMTSRWVGKPSSRSHPHTWRISAELMVYLVIRGFQVAFGEIPQTNKTTFPFHIPLSSGSHIPDVSY